MPNTYCNDNRLNVALRLGLYSNKYLDIMEATRGPHHPVPGVKFFPTPARTQQETEQATLEWRAKLLGKTLCDGPAQDQTVSILLGTKSSLDN